MSEKELFEQVAKNFSFSLANKEIHPHHLTDGELWMGAIQFAVLDWAYSQNLAPGTEGSPMFETHWEICYGRKYFDSQQHTLKFMREITFCCYYGFAVKGIFNPGDMKNFINENKESIIDSWWKYWKNYE